jgi:dTDP-4-amino-4,6-dideoxygalactose transaminase
MKVEYNYLPQQFKNPEAYFADLRELVASGEFTLGPFMERFERKFADYLGIKHVFGVNNGTDALILALKSLGIGAGDEVITVANTFYATVGAIVATGATPVFVDCDERHNIDPAFVEGAITPRTKAILPVHWAGVPADMEAILAIAGDNGLKVVEDACPAVGAKIGGRRVGTFGDVNAFSMHPLKPLHVWGDGGMIATDDDRVAEWFKLYRNHGMVDRDHIAIWGVNARLQPFQAVVASRVLDEVDHFGDLRIRNADLLDAGLADVPGVRVPPRPAEYRSVYQLYVVLVEERDALVKHLVANGIEAKVHYPLPLHLQEAASELGYQRGDFPNCEEYADKCVTMPAHQYVTPEQIDYIVRQVRAFYGVAASREAA